MNSSMNKNVRNWSILVVLIVVGVLATLWATSTVWFPRFPLGPRERGPETMVVT